MERGDFRAEWDTERRKGWVRQTANPYSIDCVLRILHSLILAEDVPAETFVDNVDRLAFDNWDEHEALYPNGKPIAEMPYPRAKAYRQVPKAVRHLLNARGLMLYGEAVANAA